MTNVNKSEPISFLKFIEESLAAASIWMIAALNKNKSDSMLAANNLRAVIVRVFIGLFFRLRRTSE